MNPSRCSVFETTPNFTDATDAYKYLLSMLLPGEYRAKTSSRVLINTLSSALIAMSYTREVYMTKNSLVLATCPFSLIRSRSTSGSTGQFGATALPKVCGAPFMQMHLFLVLILVEAEIKTATRGVLLYTPYLGETSLQQKELRNIFRKFLKELAQLALIHWTQYDRKSF